MLLATPPSDLVAALERFADSAEAGVVRGTFSLDLGTDGKTELVQLRIHDSLYLFASSSSSLSHVASIIRQHRPTFDEDIGEVVIAVSGNGNLTEEAQAFLGVRVYSLHSGLARLLRLPPDWRRTQLHTLEQALRPVLADGRNRAIALVATLPDSRSESANSWLDQFLSWRRGTEKLAYLRAEAGKGKTTTLASLIHSRLGIAEGPLPLFVPLRDLERGEGVSWPAIAARVGCNENDASLLRVAVRAGLVTLVLDGLDEVSGRHNPDVVKQVVSLISDALLTSDSMVAISGRTTEGAYFDAGKTVEASLELPDINDPSFHNFVALVLGEISPGWHAVARRLPEPLLPDASSDLQENPSSADLRQAADWICAVFDGLGKDRSLFFVQSLACIARSRQLAGNKPLIINNAVHEVPDTYDVCVLAASLACVREQDKIAAFAREFFSPSRQLDLLCLLALVASVDATTRASLATPNQLIREVFQLDGTQQPEEFSAVLHQMQKHAVLYSRREFGSSAGEWRPAFLSEWIRNTLLARAWLERARLEKFIGVGVIRTALARAERAGLAFRELLATMGDERVSGLLEVLAAEANRGSPEATVNFWALRAASSSIHSSVSPERVPPFSDFSGTSFESQVFTAHFSASMAVLNNTSFVNCEFLGCRFSDCEFVDVTFEDCTFRDSSFRECVGPIDFEACEFAETLLMDARSKRGAAYSFAECTFKAGTRVMQSVPALASGFAEACDFVDCTSVDALPELLQGDGLGFDPSRVKGLTQQLDGQGLLRLKHRCLRCVLKTFFPSRVGEPGELGARRYIRSSAIGRGAMPEGSPSQAELIQMLRSEGFTDGGRADHLYAPWSSVVGAGDASLALRNEFLDYMHDTQQGPAVTRMLVRIQRLTGWP